MPSIEVLLLNLYFHYEGQDVCATTFYRMLSA